MEPYKPPATCAPLFMAVTTADVAANKPTIANIGDLYYATDTGVSFRYNGTTWQAFANTSAFNAISAGTFANLPSSPVSGQLYKFTDSIYTDAVYNGTNWVYLINGIQCTPPSGFSWQNQGSGSVTTSHGGEILMSQLGAGSWGAGDQVICRYITYPTPPFTITMAMKCKAIPTAGSQPTNASGGLYLSDGTQILDFAIYGNGPSLVHQSGPSVNNINTNVFSPTPTPSAEIYWMRMDDGVTLSGNRTFYFSYDGINWTKIYQVSRTSFLTPTKIGYCSVAYDSNTYNEVWLAHWLQT